MKTKTVLATGATVASIILAGIIAQTIRCNTDNKHHDNVLLDDVALEEWFG